MGARRARFVESPPAGDGKRIGPGNPVVETRQMQASRRFAEQLALAGRGAARPQAVEEAEDRRRPPRELAECRARTLMDRGRADDALGSKVVHKAEEEGKIGARHALLVERQDEAAPICA